MDTGTFIKELERALQKPKDWSVGELIPAKYLTHRRSGIYIVIGRPLTYSSSATTRVYSPTGIYLGKIRLSLVTTCRKLAAAAAQKRLDRHNAERKQKFLKDFEGFS